MRPGRIRRLHFMGAGGAGMCALAELMLAEGFEVSGCDLHVSERTRSLERRGAAIVTGHDPAHAEGADALIVTAAVDPAHPEIAAARSRGIPVVTRAALLGEVMRGRTGIAIAGTHGKTTTSALAGFLLTRCGLDPTVVIGGRSPFLGGHSRRGCGRVLVCEADEYDRSFLELWPSWLVVTNVEAEHLDIYGSVGALEDAFATLAGRVSFDGAVIACTDDPGVRRVCGHVERRIVAYGLDAGAWLRAVDLEPGATGVRFTVIAGDDRLGAMTTPQHGEHNVRNALAAVAVGLELGLGFEAMADAITSFPGVARRFEIVGERDGVTVVDDYAHHPTEITALLAAARERFPGRRLVVAFQPHLYSRTQRFAGELGEALAAADAVVLTPIFPAREAPVPGVSSALVTDAVARHAAIPVVLAGSIDDAGTKLASIVRTGDVLLTVGAGDVNRLATMWLGGIR
ncbi:MAG: UDP-N-acetylmuramate--L-alanine ligase [Acidobacteria bacterium]|nr:UDP-N-acetylmuramate--L-alanine ligase [Acidobacteriota bacterium]